MDIFEHSLEIEKMHMLKNVVTEVSKRKRVGKVKSFGFLFILVRRGFLSEKFDMNIF